MKNRISLKFVFSFEHSHNISMSLYATDAFNPQRKQNANGIANLRTKRTGGPITHGSQGIPDLHNVTVFPPLETKLWQHTFLLPVE